MKFYKKIDYFIITGILIGILAFGVLYGYSTLDVSYDGWIYHTYASESVVIQHYAGWVNYRNSPWDFPIAKASILGEGGTVISFTDSIPIVAIICKIFSSVLPETFQYFGIYILVCFVLQEIVAMKLLSLYTDNKLFITIYSLFFVFSPILIERSFRHCALASHWIILFSIYFLLKSRRDNKIRWFGFCLLGLLTISIHPYFLPMVYGLFIINCIEMIIKDKKNTIKIIFGFVGNILCTCTWGYIIGALGSNNPVADKYGFFSLNLNALINPLSQGYDSWSIFFPVLPQILGNYDGFNYLGAGIIVALSGIFVLAITKRKNYNKVLFRIKNNFLLLIGCLFFTVFSVTNVVTLNDKIIFEYKLPQKLLNIFNIFRASAREFYPVYYLILLSVFYIIIKWTVSNRKKFYLLIFLVLIQFLDLHNIIIEKNRYFTTQRLENISSFENDESWIRLFSENSSCYMFDDRGNRELAVFFGKKGIKNNLRINNRDSFEQNETVMVNRSNFDINTIYCTKEKDTYYLIFDNIGDLVTTKKLGEYYILIPKK